MLKEDPEDRPWRALVVVLSLSEAHVVFEVVARGPERILRPRHILPPDVEAAATAGADHFYARVNFGNPDDDSLKFSDWEIP